MARDEVVCAAGDAHFSGSAAQPSLVAKTRKQARGFSSSLATRHSSLNTSGFTLLELVVVIIVIAILAAVALDRFWSVRVAAERAAVQQVTGNIRSALGLEVARYALENRLAELPHLDGSNPMLLLAQTPTGYQGEISPDPATIAEGSWYFDPTTKALNYRTIYAENSESSLNELRFRIMLIYRDRNHNQRFDPDLDAISGLDLVNLAQ